MPNKYLQPCPECGSSDAVTVYSDGHSYCFSCNHYKKGSQENLTETIEEQLPNIKPTLLTPLRNNFQDLEDRRISAETARKYKVTKSLDPFYSWQYPLFKGDHHVANKFRVAGPKKSFRVEGELNKSELFGQGVFPAGGQYITLTEGYDDAMAAHEMTGSKYAFVSIHSASTAAKDVANNFEYLNSFQEVVINFDTDEAKHLPDGTVRYPGQEAAVQVASMFALGKVRILTLSKHKDANDYLKAGLSRSFTEEWWKAPKYTPAGLKLAKDMWDSVSAKKNSEAVPYPWDSLNLYTFGIRKSEFVLFTAETGVGKTSVVKEIEYAILQTFLRNEIKGKLGLLHLEEPNEDTLLGLMSINADKPLHIPNVRESLAEQELRAYFDSTCNNDGLIVWDHFGSNSIDIVLNKIRHMHNLGAEYIFFDHLSIVVSDQSGDERKQLDEISTKLKTLTMELDIAVIGVIHQNRQGFIRGSAGPEQLANMVIKLFRDLEDDDPWRRNVTKLVVQKNRFSGKTGPCCYLEYVPETGRLVELTREQVQKYEQGQPKGDEDGW